MQVACLVTGCCFSLYVKCRAAEDADGPATLEDVPRKEKKSKKDKKEKKDKKAKKAKRKARAEAKQGSSGDSSSGDEAARYDL